MTKRTYDIRLRNAIARAGDPDLFPDLNIAHSLREMRVSSRYALRQATLDSAAVDSRGREGSCDASESRQIV
jgi:hypothetical protein